MILKFQFLAFSLTKKQKKTTAFIENGIYLKISNTIVFSYLEKKYLVSKFLKDLLQLTKSINKSYEVAKYVFVEQRKKLNEIRNQFLLDSNK